MEIKIEIDNEEITKRVTDEIVKEIVNEYFNNYTYEIRQIRNSVLEKASTIITSEDKNRIIERITAQATEGTIRRAVSKILMRENLKFKAESGEEE